MAKLKKRSKSKVSLQKIKVNKTRDLKKLLKNFNASDKKIIYNKIIGKFYFLIIIIHINNS